MQFSTVERNRIQRIHISGCAVCILALNRAGTGKRRLLHFVAPIVSPGFWIIRCIFTSSRLLLLRGSGNICFAVPAKTLRPKPARRRAHIVHFQWHRKLRSDGMNVQTAHHVSVLPACNVEQVRTGSCANAFDFRLGLRVDGGNGDERNFVVRTSTFPIQTGDGAPLLHEHIVHLDGSAVFVHCWLAVVIVRLVVGKTDASVPRIWQTSRHGRSHPVDPGTGLVHSQRSEQLLPVFVSARAHEIVTFCMTAGHRTVLFHAPTPLLPVFLFREERNSSTGGCVHADRSELQTQHVPPGGPEIDVFAQPQLWRGSEEEGPLLRAPAVVPGQGQRKFLSRPVDREVRVSLDGEPVRHEVLETEVFEIHHCPVGRQEPHPTTPSDVHHKMVVARESFPLHVRTRTAGSARCPIFVPPRPG
mmetsp:Transcript_18056/g.36006  ORF Transcript_18056/g.36006 Transcript_18056/m.36006 type:complete len:416 (-) Transcript_18056:2490-3737(-)